jgi:hypothetical protein
MQAERRIILIPGTAVHRHRRRVCSDGGHFTEQVSRSIRGFAFDMITKWSIGKRPASLHNQASPPDTETPPLLGVGSTGVWRSQRTAGGAARELISLPPLVAWNAKLRNSHGISASAAIRRAVCAASDAAALTRLDECAGPRPLAAGPAHLAHHDQLAREINPIAPG